MQNAHACMQWIHRGGSKALRWGHCACTGAQRCACHIEMASHTEGQTELGQCIDLNHATTYMTVLCAAICSRRRRAQGAGASGTRPAMGVGVQRGNLHTWRAALSYALIHHTAWLPLRPPRACGASHACTRLMPSGPPSVFTLCHMLEWCMTLHEHRTPCDVCRALILHVDCWLPHQAPGRPQAPFRSLEVAIAAHRCVQSSPVQH